MYNIVDQGIILSVRKYNENSLIVKILSKKHGIYSGFIKGALNSKKNRLIYQITNLVDFNWSAKIEDNLGYLKIELVKSFLSNILFDRLKLSCINILIKMIEHNILERESYENVFNDFLKLLSCNQERLFFLSKYIKFEINLLKSLGYGMDWSCCVVSGSKDDLYFISPKSGRAVSFKEGKKYQDKLFKLPRFLINNSSSINKEDLMRGLKISGFFISKYLYSDSNLKNPRINLVNLVERFL